MCFHCGWAASSLGGCGHSCCCWDTKCKLLIKSDDSQRRRTKKENHWGGKDAAHLITQLKSSGCFLWNEGWRSKEIKELKAAAFRATQNVQTWCWVCLRGRKRTFLLVCSIITHLEHQLNVWLLPDVTAHQMLMQYLPGSVGGGVLRTFSQQRR